MTNNLRNLLVIAGLAFALPLTACDKDSDDDSTTAAGSTTSDPPATSTTETPTTGTPATTTTGEDPTTEGEAEADTTPETDTDDPTTDPSTSGPGTTTDADSSSGNASVDACAAEDDDDACSMCLKTTCCDQLQDCRDDADCNCVVTCLDEMGLGSEDVGVCTKHCDAPLNSFGIALSMCQAVECKVC